MASRQETTIEPEAQSEETMLTGSNDSLDVPVKNFKKYFEATGERYIQMERANHVQENAEWKPEKPIRHTEQNISMDLRTIAIETTNDKKLLKTLLYLERQTLNQIHEEFKPYSNNLSTQFVWYFTMIKQSSHEI